MKKYLAHVFKGHHIIKSTYRDGSPYKQTTSLMFVKDSKEVVVKTNRLVRSKNKPDEWHEFAREYKGNKYWHQESGTRIQNYIAVDKFIINKILELTEKINQISQEAK